ncbi:MAG: HD domain-containing phosphohydrolase [Syntrophales bacterium]|nr:HD domain-containing phosphohydrolase [Syntrophales bacterium]
MVVRQGNFKNYLIQNFEQVFVLIVLVAVILINYLITPKVAFMTFYFLPVILAGNLVGFRSAVLGAILCVLLVVIYVIMFPDQFVVPNTPYHLYLHVVIWGGFLILAGAVVGKQHDKLKLEIEQTRFLNEQLLESYRHIENTRNVSILGLAKLSEYRDEETGKHLERIREYSKILTKELANHPNYKGYIDERYIDDIYLSSILHDIGKVGIPDAILLKPDKLTDEEFCTIKNHVLLGRNVITTIESQIEGDSFLTLGREIAHYHHERWDGKGYPMGLKAGEIPLSARIVALADVYDALRSDRIYKSAFTHQETKEIIVSERGKQFDPDIVDAFITHEDEFRRVSEKLMEKQ